jgi:erythromycin esterase
MGQILREHYQEQYLPIGFSFFQGSFRALGEGPNGKLTPLQTFTVQSSEPGSYNATLGSVSISQYMLDLRNAPAGPVSQWLDGPHDLRLTGASYNPNNESEAYISVSLSKSFDVIIHIQRTTASGPLPD